MSKQEKFSSPEEQIKIRYPNINIPDYLKEPGGIDDDFLNELYSVASQVSDKIGEDKFKKLSLTISIGSGVKVIEGGEIILGHLAEAEDMVKIILENADRLLEQSDREAKMAENKEEGWKLVWKLEEELSPLITIRELGNVPDIDQFTSNLNKLRAALEEIKEERKGDRIDLRIQVNTSGGSDPLGTNLVIDISEDQETIKKSILERLDF